MLRMLEVGASGAKQTSENAFLLALGDRLRRIKDPAEILVASAAAIGERLGMSRAGFARVDHEKATLRVERDWTDGTVAPGTGEHRIADFGPSVTSMLFGGETQRIADMQSDPRIEPVDRPAFEAMGIVSAVTVPLVRDNQLVGVFSTHGTAPREWTDAEVRLIEQVAERSWAAHELALTAARLKESEARLAFLLGLSDATRNETNATVILERTASMLARELGLTRVSYGDVDEEADVCTVRHAWGNGVEGGHRSHRMSLFGEELCANHRAGITYVTEDASVDPLMSSYGRELAEAIGAKAMLTVPLVRDGIIRAYLSVHDRSKRQWSEGEVRLVQEVAERTWATLVRAHTEEELRQSETMRAFLLSLADQTRLLADPEAILSVTTDLLSAHAGVDAASYSSIDWSREIVRTAHFRRREAQAFHSDYPITVLAGELLYAHLRGEVFRSDDVAGDARISTTTKEICRGLEVASIMSAPLVKDGQLVGLLSMSHDHPRAWSDEEAQLLAEVAERTWANLDRAVTAIELRERDASSAFLLDLGDRLRECAAASDMLQCAVEAVGQRLGVNRVGYAEIDDAADMLTVDVEWGDGSLVSIKGTYPFAAFGKGHVTALRAGETTTIEDIATDERVGDDGRPAVLAMQVRSGLTVPLIREGRLVALLSAHHGEPREWKKAEVRLVEEVAERTWAIVERARAEADLARSQEALYQSEKLTALGSLLAGLSHEMNNPLSVVVLQSVMMEEDSAGSSLAGRARRIREAAERCSRIVATFLAMARQRPPERMAVDLNKVVEGALGLAAYGLRSSGIGVERALNATLPTIEGDADQLHQVLVNLVINAQHALQNVSGERKLRVASRLGRQPGTIEIEVADNGPGIAPEARRRIFEPFFSTKPQGAGTGLGLSFSLGVVEAHGGRLELTEAEGGASFLITLPTSVQSALSSDDSPGHTIAADEVTAEPTRLALIVDDEPEIADTLGELLEREGYKVRIASSGREAREQLALQDYDLILSDLRMPDGDGASLYAWVAAERPHLTSRLGFVTGDTIEPNAGAFLASTDRPRLEKPFTPGALKAFIDDVLGASR